MDNHNKDYPKRLMIYKHNTPNKQSQNPNQN